MEALKSTLLISTYNWPEALELVLMSIKNQKVLPIEVIIADDGSTQATKQLIERFKSEFPVPLIHVWQKDTGFKKSHILNKAIACSIGDYIIQCDGDCILHPFFVKDHLKFAIKNHYLYGSRVNIKASYLERLFATKQIKFNFFSNGIKKRTRTIYLPILSRLYISKLFFSNKVRGCNLSYWKSDFLAVNGYNEDMIGWGREDSELILRMHNKRVRSRRLRYRGIVYHIWHMQKSKARLNINDQIEQTVIYKTLTWCENGINRYLSK